MEHYTPKDATASQTPHEIIALMGEPGSGKTTGCITFPNRIWGDIDHKLPTGELAVPMWDPIWVDSILPKGYRRAPIDPANHRDAIKKWTRENCTKFAPDQTYIKDSWTLMQGYFDQQTRLEDERLEKPNAFWFWKQKINYSTEMVNYIKNFASRVVVTFHETRERDEEGVLTGRMRPVQDGSFKDQIFGHFTDVWRAVQNPRVWKRDSGGKRIAEIKEGFYWQLAGDEVTSCNTNPVLGMKIRRHGIKYVSVWIDKDTGAVCGGYHEIQRIYNTESFKVIDGFLQPSV